MDDDNRVSSPTWEKRPQVYIVGAGPGHSAFLTLRAVQCLAQAELVIYDKLVPEELLEHAPEFAERFCVADLAVPHRDRYLPVQELMVKAAKEGKTVVRLKGGDPFVFGRGGEEVEALRKNGIRYEVVPGVTAAVGVTACAGIPLTHRSHSSAVALVTGHENPDKPESIVDWAALAKFPGTIVVYMGLSRSGHIAASLIQHGMSPTTPAAVIYLGTTGYQKTVTASLIDLANQVQNEGLTSPSLIVIGDVVKLRDELDWFEQRPLFGQRVLVTRPRKQARELANRLEQLGAIPFVLPAIDIRELSDWSIVDNVLKTRLKEFHWLGFTSANGVHSLLRRLWHLGMDWRALGHVKIAAIGSKTAEVLRHYHLQPDLVPTKYRSEEFAEEWKPLAKGQRVLLARANRGRDVLPRQLAEVAEVEQITVYDQIDSVDSESEELNKLRRGEISYVTLTSPSIARAFLHTIDDICRQRIESGEIKLVAISPVTGEVIRELGLPVAAEAEVYTTDGLLEALTHLVKTNPAQLVNADL